MESYLAELQQVSRAVLAVSRELSSCDALRVIVRSARTLVHARYAALGVPDDHGSFGEFVVGGITAAQQRAIGPLPRQHGMLGALLRSGSPERLEDIRKDPRFEGWPAAHPELTGFLGVPIQQGGEVLGIIFVANKRSGSFTAQDEELLTLFAAHAAIALTNARLYERSRELSVLVLTSVTDPSRAQQAVRAGAAGVLYKDIDPDALVRAIRSVHDGNLLLAASAARPLLYAVRHGGVALTECDTLVGGQR